MRRALVCCLMAASLSAAAKDDDDWRVWRERDGIRLAYLTQKNGLVEILGELEVSGDEKRFMALLGDTERAPDWLAGVSEVKILDEPSPAETVVYTHLSAPWPVSDRDFVSYSCYRRISPEHTELVIRGIPDYLPPVKGRIRIPRLMARWRLLVTESGLSVRYRAQADPGGAVPNWLSNKVALGNAFNTLKNLKREMQGERYRNTEPKARPGECPLLEKIEGGIKPEAVEK